MYVCTQGIYHVSLGVIPHPDGGLRGPSSLTGRKSISGFTGRSKSRLAAYLRDAFADYRYMGTLTYPARYPNFGPEAKGHLDSYLKWHLAAMRRLADDSFRQAICWFLEFQRRGAPHFHLFYTEHVDWSSAAKKWADVIEQPDCWRTSTRYETLRSGRGGTVSYARKYAAKQHQKDVPDGFRHVGRFWGVRGNRQVVTATIRWLESSGGREAAQEAWELMNECAKDGIARRFRWPAPAQGAIFFFPGGIPKGTAARLTTGLGRRLTSRVRELKDEKPISYGHLIGPEPDSVDGIIATA